MDFPTSSQIENQPETQAGTQADAALRAAVSGAPGPAVVSASSAGSDAPIRLGLIGLGVAGQFHAERLSLRSEFEIVAACDPGSQQARRLPGPRGAERPVEENLAALLARSEVAAVLITGPTAHRAEWAARSLEAGKHVCLDPPPCANASELRDLRSLAQRAGRQLTILPTFRSGADFRTALDVARGGRLGSLYSARLLAWGKLVPPVVTAPASARAQLGAASAVPDEVDPFAHFAYQYVDQALQLLGRCPQSVFARILPTESAPTSLAFTLTIGFDAGVDALIDVNLNSGAALQTGWMLAGARGGYTGGRIYLQDESGEVCDAPVPPPDRPASDVYAELLASIRGEPRPESSADAEMVMRILDAAGESSRTAQSVRAFVS